MTADPAMEECCDACGCFEKDHPGFLGFGPCQTFRARGVEGVRRDDAHEGPAGAPNAGRAPANADPVRERPMYEFRTRESLARPGWWIVTCRTGSSATGVQEILRARVHAAPSAEDTIRAIAQQVGYYVAVDRDDALAVAERRLGELRHALETFISCADWYRRCLENVTARRQVRGLAEAHAGYDSALAAARAALASDEGAAE